MLPLAPFGRTGHQSTRVIFGAAGLGSMTQERADATLAMVVESGINHIDTAAGYGESEVRLRPWLADHRGDVFLATKTGERRGTDARAELERSLERMAVEQVDLIQLHNLVEPDEWDVAFAPDGAVAALAAARDEGLVRFIGVTGHGMRIAGMHLRSLEQFDFDSVLLPYNFTVRQDADYRRDVDRLQEICAEREIAVQTIKAIARRRWQAQTEQRFSWYEPLTDPDAIGRAVHYVLADQQVFLVTTSDARLVPHIVEAAGRPVVCPTDDEMRADCETFAISPLFDGAELERI
jgi:aryl-alcohol dehydrogenase-like predicted oxidoreductase